MADDSVRTWFITGTSRGLGRAFAEEALAAGDRVAATARDPGAVADLVEKYGDQVLPVRLDVRDRAAVVAAVRHAESELGHIDVLVNNAGYGLAGAVEEVTEEQVRDQFDTNVFGALWCSQAVLPLMRQRGTGYIVQVSSVAGLTTYPNLGMYCASKWALEGFSETLAQEVTPFGITVILLELGEFRTEWSAGSLVRAEPMAAYDDILAKRRHGLSGAYAHLQPGDPAAAARALLEILAAEDKPRRVLLGNGAATLIPEVYRQRLAEWAKWEKLARSVDFAS